MPIISDLGDAHLGISEPCLKEITSKIQDAHVESIEELNLGEVLTHAHEKKKKKGNVKDVVALNTAHKILFMK